MVYYAINAMFPSYLQRELHLTPRDVAIPVMCANAAAFLAMGFWGWVADRLGRRWSMIIPAIIGLFVTPLYLVSTDFVWIAVGFTLQGAFAGAIYGQNPSYLCERFPTEVRGTASGFCYHQGTIFGAAVPLVLTYFAVDLGIGLAMAMLVVTVVSCVSFVFAILAGPETRGKELTAELQVA